MSSSNVLRLFLLCVLYYQSSSAHKIQRRNVAELGPIKFLPEIPSPRQEHSVAIVNNQVIIVGGISSNYSYTPDTISEPSTPTTVDLVQAYDIKSQTWSDLSPVPVVINHGNIAVVADRMYLLGGLSGANFTLWGAIPDSFVYDTKSDSWTAIEPMPRGFERGAAAVGVYGSKIFLAGGMRSLEIGESGVQDSVVFVSSYDMESDTWNTEYPPLPEARDHLGGAVIDGRFYVIGGRIRGQRNVRGDTWVLNLEDTASGWQVLPSMPTARGGLAAAAAGRCLYTFGGEGNPSAPSGVFSNIEVFDTHLNRWEALEPLWAGIHGTHAVTGSDRNIYIPGGGFKLGAGASNFTISYKTEDRCYR